MAVSSAGETAARELTQRYAEKAMRAVVALAKTGKSARVRVSAAKTVLRGDATFAEKIAIEALVEVMDGAKSEGAQLSAAKEILRVSRVRRVEGPAASAPQREREPVPLPPALAALVSGPPPAQLKRWQLGTALRSGTIPSPR